MGGSESGPADGIERILFGAGEIAHRVEELGAQLGRDFAGRRPLLVGVLNGCFPFMADLVRAMDIELEVDFIRVSSYGDGRESSGVVRIGKDLDTPIEGRHVVLVEDIVDTGLTLRYLLDNLRTRGPASLVACTLLDKHGARTVDADVQYVGFPCPDVFVVGYGLDHAGLHRNLPYVGVVAT